MPLRRLQRRPFQEGEPVLSLTGTGDHFIEWTFAANRCERFIVRWIARVADERMMSFGCAIEAMRVPLGDGTDTFSAGPVSWRNLYDTAAHV